MSNRPNILMIMPDQMRADCIGAAGNPAIRTPHLDALSARGMRFDAAYTAAPICLPSRVSFLSGRYPHNHHCWINQDVYPSTSESVFRRLQSSGYYTAHIGKSHYTRHVLKDADAERPVMIERGFDYVHEVEGPRSSAGGALQTSLTRRWAELGLDAAVREDYRRRSEFGLAAAWPSVLPEEEYNDTYVGRLARDFVDGYAEDRPLCLYVGFPGPHEPFDPPHPYADLYDPAEMPAPIPLDEEGAPTDDYAARRMSQRGVGSYAHFDPDLDEDQIRKVRAMYYGNVTLIDRWVGEILSVFERRGELENTVVLFWSDHGEMLGDHRRLLKGEFFESVVRVPLILSWPGRVSGGTSSSSLVSLTDLFGTLLEIAGTEPPANYHGTSLLRVADDPDRTIHDVVFSEISLGGHTNVMVRTRGHKYALDETGRGYLLFDLEKDPHEHCNLMGRSPGIEAEMRDRLITFLVASQIRSGDDQ